MPLTFQVKASLGNLGPEICAPTTPKHAEPISHTLLLPRESIMVIIEKFLVFHLPLFFGLYLN